MNSDSILREKIMRRVWGVYIVRQFTSPALRLGVMGMTAIALVSSVSMKHIVENALATSGLSGLARFSLSAFTDTTVFVQVLLFLAVTLAIWFIVDAVRNAAFTQQMRAWA